jgi:hypothetical protein
VGTMVALGILVAPAALFGLFHKTKLHYIGIEYNTDEGKKAGMLLQGHKDNYRAVLQALKSVSGKDIQTDQSERLNLARNPEGQRSAESDQPAASSSATAKTEGTARVTITAPVTGSEVDLDGHYIGGTPITVEIQGGNHTVTVKNGEDVWQRELQVFAGNAITVQASFPEKDPVASVKEGQTPQQAHQPRQVAPYADCGDSMPSIPVSSSKTGMKSLQCGQEVTILSQDGNWTRIRTADGKEGYVSTKFISTKR